MEMVVLKVDEPTNDLNDLLYTVQHPAKNKLATFAGLNDGWHLGEGRRFPQLVLDQVNQLIDECLGNNFFEIDVFPGLDADIRLSIYETPNYYEFTVGESISYCHERNDVEQTYQEEMSLDDARLKIGDIGKQKWTSSGYSIYVGSISNVTDFKVWHLNAVQGYPYLRSNAPLLIADAPVVIYPDIMQT
jgi:hypothetical protein